MDTEIKEFKQKIVSLPNEFPVFTADDYERAAIALKSTKALLKTIEDKEKEITRPLNEGLKKARDLFRPMKEKLTNIISHISSNMGVWRKQEQERIEREKAAIAENVMSDDVAFIPDVVSEIPKTEVKVRKNWRFKVIDKNKIKPEFLIPDEKTIGELVRKLQSQAVEIIGGIEVFCEETTY